MPTALTEKHHIPIRPFIDYAFFSYCRKQGVPIGLFYRDIYWRFKQYQHLLPLYKRLVVKFFYFYDLVMYNRYVNILYLPSKAMIEYIPIVKCHVEELPPGINAINLAKQDITSKNKHLLRFVYVGGLNPELYDLTMFTDCLNDFPKTFFNLCTRKNEWKAEKLKYNTHNLKIWHLWGEELKNVYNNSDVAVLFIRPTPYRKFVMPIKLFEYLSYRKPVIGVKGTAAGAFIEKNDVGWVIEFKRRDLENLIAFLISNPSEINKKTKKIDAIFHHNTWEARARKVEEELCKEYAR